MPTERRILSLAALTFHARLPAAIPAIPVHASRAWAMNKQGRKAAVARLIADCYPNISKDDLAGASPGQIDTKLSDKHYRLTDILQLLVPHRNRMTANPFVRPHSPSASR